MQSSVFEQIKQTFHFIPSSHYAGDTNVYAPPAGNGTAMVCTDAWLCHVSASPTWYEGLIWGPASAVTDTVTGTPLGTRSAPPLEKFDPTLGPVNVNPNAGELATML